MAVGRWLGEVRADRPLSAGVVSPASGLLSIGVCWYFVADRLEEAMPKGMSERVSDSFGSDFTSDVQGFMETLLSSWRDTSKSINRESILIVGLMALFELLVYQGPTRSFTVGPFSFVNTPVIQIVLPALVGFLVYDLQLLTTRWDDQEMAYSAILKKYNSKAIENGLQALIAPSIPAFWNLEVSDPGESLTQARRFANTISLWASVVAIGLIPLAFAVQAYYLLFEKFGYQNALLWISTVFTAGMVLLVIMYLTKEGS